MSQRTLLEAMFVVLIPCSVVTLPLAGFVYFEGTRALLSLDFRGAFHVLLSGLALACYVLGWVYIRMLWKQRATVREHRCGAVATATGSVIALVGTGMPSWIGASFLGLTVCGVTVFTIAVTELVRERTAARAT